MAIVDLGAAGTWRIDPATSMVIPGGHDSTAYLYLQAERFAEPGDHLIYLTVTSGTQKTSVPIRLYVRGTLPQENNMFVVFMQLFLIFFVLILIVVAIVLAIKMRNKGAKAEKNGMKNETKSSASSAAVTSDAKASTKANASKAAKTASKNNTAAKQTKTVAVEPAGNAKRQTYY
jgi:cytoskeletal protein RodZ